MLSVDRHALGITSVLGRTIGPNLKIFDDARLFDKKTLRFLKRANARRNDLIHRFVLDNVIDMTSAVGRKAVNDKLHGIFTDIFTAHKIVSTIKNELLSKLGYDEDWARKKFQELNDAVSDFDGNVPEHPYE